MRAFIIYTSRYHRSLKTLYKCCLMTTCNHRRVFCPPMIPLQTNTQPYPLFLIWRFLPKDGHGCNPWKDNWFSRQMIYTMIWQQLDDTWEEGKQVSSYFYTWLYSVLPVYRTWFKGQSNYYNKHWSHASLHTHTHTSVHTHLYTLMHSQTHMYMHRKPQSSIHWQNNKIAYMSSRVIWS